MAKDKKKPEIDYISQSLADKSKALETTILQLEKSYGKGSIMKFGQRGVVDIPSIPTGSLSLDVALGIGGVPRGRIVEVYGPESSGKTTLALHIVAEAQKLGGIAAYVDAEHALDPIYAKKIGVNIDEMYISQPDDGEQALEITESMVRSGAIDVVVVDSVAALVPRAEIEGDMGDSHMGLQARLMSQALRKLAGIISKTNCTVIFINQLREKIGVTYGSNETTTGGRALKFYASIRLDIRRSEYIKSGTDFIGSRTRVKVAKNKLAPPFKVCEFDIMYGEGIASAGDVLDLAADLNIIKKSGSWYSYNDDKIGQGRETAKQFLIDNPDVSVVVENEVREHYGLSQRSDANDKGDKKAKEEPKKAGKASKAKDKKDEDAEEISNDIAVEMMDSAYDEEDFDDEDDDLSDLEIVD